MTASEAMGLVPWGEWRSAVAALIVEMNSPSRPRTLTAILRVMALLRWSEPDAARQMMAYAHREPGWGFDWWAEQYVDAKRAMIDITTIDDSLILEVVCRVVSVDSWHELEGWGAAPYAIIRYLRVGGDMPMCNAWCAYLNITRTQLDEALERGGALSMHERDGIDARISRCVHILDGGGVPALVEESRRRVDRAWDGANTRMEMVLSGELIPVRSIEVSLRGLLGGDSHSGTVEAE